MSEAEAVTKHCDACLKGSVLPGKPKGEMIKMANLNTYLAKGNATGDKAIVIAADAFGLGIPNPKLIADEISAKTGLDVYVPDLLQGDYPPLDKIHVDPYPQSGKPLLQRLTGVFKTLSSFILQAGPTFFYRHRMAVTMPLAKEFLLVLRRDKSVKRIGMVGYCLGGQLCTLLAGSEPADGVKYIDVAVTAHPGVLRASDFSRIHVPFALLCAEEDFSFDPIKKNALVEIDKLQVPHSVYEHPGTVHGFGARPDLTDPTIKEQYQKALNETIDWFKTHV